MLLLLLVCICLTICFFLLQARKAGPDAKKKKTKTSDSSDDDTESDEDSASVKEDLKPPAKPAKKEEQGENYSFEDHLTEDFGKMSVASTTPFSLGVQFPYLLYSYKEDDRDRVTVDFLVVAQAQDAFRPVVPPGGTELHVGMALPKFFIDRTRLLEAKAGDATFTINTNKATSFSAVVEKVEASAGITDDNRDTESFELLSTPMKVKLPFVCEEEIVEWEMQAFQNNDVDFTDACAGLQYFFILTVTLQSVVKKKERKAGGFRVIASPTRDANMADAGGDV